MKKLSLILCSLMLYFSSFSQAVYIPSKGSVTAKPIAPSAGVPTDARSYFYDSLNFRWRPYLSVSEVLSFLSSTSLRRGHFPIIVNSGGTLLNGVVTGGVNSEYWFRNGYTNADLVLKGTSEVSDFVSPDQFNSFSDDNVPDQNGFNAMTTFAATFNKGIKLRPGRYKLNTKWQIPGKAGWVITGSGDRNTILDFSGSPDTSAVILGSDLTNTLHADVSNFSIEGTPNMDGFVVSSWAPTAAAWNEVRNIYMTNVRDGLSTRGNPANTTSNFQNFFRNITVEKYFRYGIFSDGAMNVYDGGFIVQPNGEKNPTNPDTSLGAKTLAVYDVGGGNEFRNIPSEDQWVLSGSGTKVSQCTIEFLMKGKPSTIAGPVAMRIAAFDTHVDGFIWTGFNKNVVNQFGSVYSAGVSLKNIVYVNPGDNPLFRIDYPILPAIGSSGIMENVLVQSTYGLNHPVFEDNLFGWTILETAGQATDSLPVFARIRGLKLPPQVVGGGNPFDQDLNTFNSPTFSSLRSNGTYYFGNKGVIGTDGANFYFGEINTPVFLQGTSLYWSSQSGVNSVWHGGNRRSNEQDDARFLGLVSGGTVTGYTSVNDFKIANSGEFRGLMYDFANWYMPSKAGGYLSYNVLNTTGAENLRDFNFINSVNLNTKIPVKFGGSIDIDSVLGITTNGREVIGRVRGTNTDTANGGIILQYKALGQFQDGLILDGTGNTDLSSLVFSKNKGFFADNSKGTIYKNATHGLLFKGATGAQNDFTFVSVEGQLLLRNPTGSNDVVLGNSIGQVIVPTTITASPAVLGVHVPNLDQVKSLIRDSLSATGFTLRSANGNGYSLFTSPATNMGIVKNFNILGPGVSVTTSNDSTLNFRVGVSVQGVASAATVTPDLAFDNGVKVLAQATALTIANPTGSPQTMQRLTFRIRDNGTAQTITWGSQYRAIGTSLPTTTVAGQLLYVEAIANLDEGVGVTVWDIIHVHQQGAVQTP